MQPNFFSSSLTFWAGLAQESWRDLATVIFKKIYEKIGADKIQVPAKYRRRQNKAAKKYRRWQNIGANKI